MSAIALPARLTLPHASTALRGVEAALASGSAEDGDLTLDAAAVVDVDSSAVALVLQARRLAAARGRSVVLVSPPDKLLALARLYGVEPLLAPGSASPA